MYNLKKSAYVFSMVHYYWNSCWIRCQQIHAGGGFGLFTNLLVGVVGGVLGGWVFGLLGITTTGLLGSLITSIVGAVVLLWIVSLFNNKKRIEL